MLPLSLRRDCWQVKLGVAIIVGCAAGLASLVIHRSASSDYGLIHRGALALRNGEDVFAVRHEAFPFIYPLTAAMVGVPLSYLPGPDFWFTALGIGLFLWATWGRFPFAWMGLASAAGYTVVQYGQWAALITAAALLPAAGFLLAAKPTLGGALWIAFPSVISLTLATGLVALSLYIDPNWPAAWLETARSAFHVRAPIQFWGGPLLLLALFRWRSWDARLLAALSCVPQTPLVYETLPLFLIPRTLGESVYLVLASWVTFVATEWWTIPLKGLSPRDLYFARTQASGQLMVLLLYLPCLVMIFRRRVEAPVSSAPHEKPS